MYGDNSNNYAQPQYGQINPNNSHVNNQINQNNYGQDSTQKQIQAQVTRPEIGHSRHPGTVPQGEGGCCCAIF